MHKVVVLVDAMDQDALEAKISEIAGIDDVEIVDGSCEKLD